MPPGLAPAMAGGAPMQAGVPGFAPYAQSPNMPAPGAAPAMPLPPFMTGAQ